MLKVGQVRKRRMFASSSRGATRQGTRGCRGQVELWDHVPDCPCRLRRLRLALLRALTPVDSFTSRVRLPLPHERKPHVRALRVLSRREAAARARRGS